MNKIIYQQNYFANKNCATQRKWNHELHLFTRMNSFSATKKAGGMFVDLTAA